MRESDVTVTGGNGQLDGVSDNDGNQRLDGAQTIDGVTYNDNTRVEAEYGFTVTDGTNSWTLIGINVRNSSPAFGTVEGLAFIGGPADFPPVGGPLTVTSTFENPSFAAADYTTAICLVAGTVVETAKGPVPIETVTSCMFVKTRDHGLQPVHWVGQRTVKAVATFAPVRIAASVIGNTQPLWVSQQHRVLVETEGC